MAPRCAAMSMIRIGTAGWAIPKAQRDAFPDAGSQLERYAQRFNAVEINSSFYRPHRRATYERWAASVPGDFMFAVKVPRSITHELRLGGAETALDAFLAQATGLGNKLGVLLVQLPPSLALDEEIAAAFLQALRARHAGAVVIEPRHATWFSPRAQALLINHGIARVAADPAVVPAAAEPGGASDLCYIRLHGAPRMYYSDYAPEEIVHYAAIVMDAATPAWCIFDNTALGAATGNALALAELISTACRPRARRDPHRR
jgi:uncharacterized protein YecE (DUF72 family)